MSYGRSRLYENGDVAEWGDVAAAPVASRDNAVRDPRQVMREIDTLRSTNAHLVRQIETLKRRQAQAQRLADRDGLTGLYNRRRMVELLAASISDASQQRQRVGLLFVDLDGFKGINDDYGHAAGDKLLITVAARIAARTRTGDFVCRYGGDEFVVILPRVADLAAAQQVAQSIRKKVALPYRIDGADLRGLRRRRFGDLSRRGAQRGHAPGACRRIDVRREIPVERFARGTARNPRAAARR